MGIFKKKETCDLILKNANIYLDNPELDGIDSIGIKDGIIKTIGNFDLMEDLISANTEVIDLEGKYIYPGFIDIHSNPVINAFKGLYLDLEGAKDLEEIKEKIRKYINDNENLEVVFGYGFNNIILKDIDKTALDDIETELPIMLLSSDNIRLLGNSVANEVIKQSLEEDGIINASLDYILNLLIPFDLEKIDEKVKISTNKYIEHGFTSIHSLKAPDYMESLFKDSLVGLYNLDELNIRFLTSFYLVTPLNERYLDYKINNRRTSCIEMDRYILANHANVEINEDLDYENIKNNLIYLSERHINIFMYANTKESLRIVYKLIDEIRGKGYKNELVIVSDEKLDDEELGKLMFSNDALDTIGYDTKLIDSVKDTAEYIDELTIYAAEYLGLRDKLGSIEEGKLADFAIFDKDLLKLDLKEVKNIKSCFNVINGKIANKKEEN